MTNYLLDTNAISEAVKSRHNTGYMNWLNSTDDSRMYVSCLTIGEIQKGISLVGGISLRKRLEAYLAGLFDAFSGRILDLNLNNCQFWGELMAKAQVAGKTPQVIDSLLAAQAIQNDLTLVTRNVKDFEQFTALKTLCPWD